MNEYWNKTYKQDNPEFSRETLAQVLTKVTNDAGGAAPTFFVMNPRDFWVIKRGEKCRYPLPVRKTFASKRKPSFQQRMNSLIVRRLRLVDE